MSGSDYLLGYNQGRNSAENERETNALIERVIYARRTVQVDQSYLDRIRRASNHNFEVGTQAQRDAAWWEDKARQFRDEALYWRDQKFAPAEAEAKELCEENAVLQAENAALLARLQERSPDLAEEQAAHDETFREKQSLHRFRIIATSLIDALLAGRADRPEFAELLNMAKDAADTIERGDLFTAFRDEPEKNNRLCSLADALQKP